MRFFLVDHLVSPETRSSGFRVFAAELSRESRRCFDVVHDDIQPADDIVRGVLCHEETRIAYPIQHGVLSLLAQDDADHVTSREALDAILPACPKAEQAIIEETLAKHSREIDTTDGDWNREEMRYYDAAVDTPEKRKAMRDDIQRAELPHIFVPRKRYLLDIVSRDIQGKTVVEIGCGNARTIVRLMRPRDFDFTYIGTDISFQRLVVAKQACPESEFVQASAFNLPFADGIADVGLSFGMLHHLPRPVEGLRGLNRVVKKEAYLALHEPIASRKLITGRFPQLEKALETYQHSEHDGEIDLNEFQFSLNQLGYGLKVQKFLNSPFRTAVEAITNRLFPRLLKSPRLFGLLLTFDSLAIQLLSHFSDLLGPRAVVLLANRNVTHSDS